LDSEDNATHATNYKRNSHERGNQTGSTKHNGNHPNAVVAPAASKLEVEDRFDSLVVAFTSRVASTDRSIALHQTTKSRS
jgi:hypothetical protein